MSALVYRDGAMVDKTVTVTLEIPEAKEAKVLAAVATALEEPAKTPVSSPAKGAWTNTSLKTLAGLITGMAGEDQTPPDRSPGPRERALLTLLLLDERPLVPESELVKKFATVEPFSFAVETPGLVHYCTSGAKVDHPMPLMRDAADTAHVRRTFTDDEVVVLRDHVATLRGESPPPQGDE